MKRSISIAQGWGIPPIVVALLLLSPLPFVNAPTALAVNIGEWTGRVEHVSTENIKVYSWKEKASRSFLLVPKFARVFSGKGNTTYQMSQIKPGMIVKVYYDQRGLGARHADRILVLGGNELPIRNLKS